VSVLPRRVAFELFRGHELVGGKSIERSPTDLGADDIQHGNLDRIAKPRSRRATFVVVVQTAKVWDGDDPGSQSMRRPLKIAIVYAPGDEAALGLIWVSADVAGDRKRPLQINGPQQR
jgi:hypothetical protein